MAGSPYNTLRDASVDNTNQVAKVGNGEVAYFQVTNGGTVDAYLHFYDALTADVTVGSSPAPIATFLVPAGTAADHAGAYEYNGPPIKFEVGLVYAATTTFAGGTNPTTKPALGIMSYR